jgi:2-polyprenyl-3-methyl-5-hydroxy-6-metoxy-1,4-benzoquinol methylase
MESLDALERSPSLQRLLRLQIEEYPASSKFFNRRFAGVTADELKNLETIAFHVSKLIEGREAQFAQDYAWLCDMQIAEELHFRRHGRYRLSTFAEALEQVYANKPFMTRYMNGLLMTQLWWSNHSAVSAYYRDVFLAGNKPGYAHLEIGPGHGLFLYFAAIDPRAGSIEGWDISEASAEQTRHALTLLGLTRMPVLRLQDMFETPTGAFDSIVFSEVLEHMEKPGEALGVLRDRLSADGRLFINMPINSPAPDHLFNAESPEALVAFVGAHGLKVVDSAFYPGTNQTLEQSRAKKLTINCALIAVKA